MSWQPAAPLWPAPVLSPGRELVHTRRPGRLAGSGLLPSAAGTKAACKPGGGDGGWTEGMDICFCIGDILGIRIFSYICREVFDQGCLLKTAVWLKNTMKYVILSLRQYIVQHIYEK